jgi:hypothetical protein
VGCGGNPEIAQGDGDHTGGTAGSSASGSGGISGSINVGATGGDPGTDGGSGNDTDPCAVAPCGPGQRCEEEGGEAKCVDNECSELECEELEECQPAPGGGFQCTSIACNSDVQCPESRYCDGTRCVDDVCEPEKRTCDGNDVLVCSSNGGESSPAYSCGSAGYYESECAETASAGTGCSCEDDWDCPEFTACEAGVCTGTGVAPTCSLPVKPFEDVLPTLEFHWGGTDSANKDAVGKPFAWSAQAGTTPIVINLDDDNGDGVANELDFPEIVFMTYHGDNPDDEGVVRAVHGGGPNKGGDMFALCGNERWFEGDPVATDCDPTNAGDSRAAATGRASGGLAAGDLDGDGFPEIVFPLENGGLQILSNTGEIIATSPAGLWFGITPSNQSGTPAALASGDWKYPAPAIANLDFEGLPEIIVGSVVLTLKLEAGVLAFDKKLTGSGTTGTTHQNDDEFHHGPTVCPADLTSHPGLEIVAGTTLYRLPDVVSCTANPTADYCTNKLTVVWNASTVNPGDIPYPEGFCAVADVWGAGTDAPGPGNPLDGSPEVLVIADGNLLILDGATGALIREPLALSGGEAGGAPNVDDFDGDGFPEIGTALEDFFTVLDLQEPTAACPAWNTVLAESGAAPPGGNAARTPGGACETDADCAGGGPAGGTFCNDGACSCLHNSWRRASDDSSSKVTSSSVFDFNGDGAAEVIYNDQCYFRVYNGQDGSVYLALPSLSRTIIENPIVADVDNDGNAEIVFLNNTDPLRCHGGATTVTLNSWPDGVDDVAITSLPNGIDVWGDESDQWVAARRVWNQHAYHVTNVTEGGGIPLHEPESWKPLNGRIYNTYRSQPRNYNVAPDLALLAIQVSSPGEACGQLSNEIQIVVQVKNQGDLRVGPGVVLDFFGVFEDGGDEEALLDGAGDPVKLTLDKSLEPGASTLVRVSFEAGNNPTHDGLPLEVRAVIDGANAELECIEDNNSISGPVEAGEELADLRLEVTSASDCRSPKVKLTVTNDGSASATDVLVRLYAGDPSSGGTLLGEVTIDGPIAPGESESVTVELERPIMRDIVVWGVADPLGAIEECNDANNVDRGPRLNCAEVK